MVLSVGSLCHPWENAFCWSTIEHSLIQRVAPLLTLSVSKRILASDAKRSDPVRQMQR